MSEHKQAHINEQRRQKNYTYEQQSYINNHLVPFVAGWGRKSKLKDTNLFSKDQLEEIVKDYKVIYRGTYLKT